MTQTREQKIEHLRKYRLENADYIRSKRKALYRARREDFFSGKKCEWCGSDNNLVIHHTDPSKKENSAVLNLGKKKRELELAKCIVICDACHRKYHANNRNIKPIDHGTVSGYSRGCRCQACKEASRIYKHESRIRIHKNDNHIRGRPPKYTDHGTAFRYESGCRCEKCRGAHLEYERESYPENIQEKGDKMTEDDGSLSKLDDKLNIAINKRHKMALMMIARSMQISLSDMARIALNEYVTRRYPDYDNLLNNQTIPKKEVIKNGGS